MGSRQTLFSHSQRQAVGRQPFQPAQEEQPQLLALGQHPFLKLLGGTQVKAL